MGVLLACGSAATKLIAVEQQSADRRRCVSSHT